MLASLKEKQPLRVDVDITTEQLQSWLAPTHPIELGSPVTGVCLDSRDILPGDLFFALQAARDGHDFAKGALEKGAAGVVVCKDLGLQSQIRVRDTLQALHDLARSYRRAWKKTVVAISGSNGKTTTKEMCGALLGNASFVSPGTWNNHLGIALSILMLRDHHEVAVLEMGINDFGDLTGYCSYAEPDIGVLTVIGLSHLMNLKNQQGVAKAKGELFQALGPKGTAIVLKDDALIVEQAAQASCQKIYVSVSQDASVEVSQSQDDQVTVRYGGAQCKASFNMQGAHNLKNLACALGVAFATKAPLSDLEERICKIKPLNMRMQSLESADGVSWILDCYNANPTSMNAGLDQLASVQGRKIALLGDMLELGEDSSMLHVEIGKTLAGLDLAHVFLFGQFSQDYFQGALLGGMAEEQLTILTRDDQPVEKIRVQLQKGDTVYVKGSRGVRLENLVNPLM